MALTAKSIVEDSIELYSLPDIYFQIRDIIQSPRCSADAIGQVLVKDPALSLRLLKIVNSAVYGFQAKIDTISRAVTIVGMSELQTLILATSTIDHFKKIPGDLVDMTDFWIQSINCAVIAKLLAKKSSVLHSERLFLAGLLHDIGALVIYTKFPEQAAQILLKAEGNRSMLMRLELELIGFSRAEIGGELVRFWGLPESLAEVIYYQLEPGAALVHRMDAHLLFLAIGLSNGEHTTEEVLATVSEDTFSILRLNRDQIEQAIALAVDEFNAIFGVLVPGGKSSK